MSIKKQLPFLGNIRIRTETFITKIVSGDLPQVVKQFGWTQENIVPCKQSLEWIAQSDTDPVRERREELLTVIPALVKNGDEIILIKGQDIDLENNRLVRLQKKLPQAQHGVVFLNLPFDEVFERVKSKSWWEETDTKEELQKWLRYQIGMLLKLPKSFKMTAINSSEDANYEKVPFPPAT